MSSPFLQTLESRILSIVSPVYQNGQTVTHDLHGMAEVKLFVARLNHMQKQLRDLKRDLAAEKKSFRMAYSAQRANISHPFMSLFGGKKNAIHLTALQREQSRQNEQRQMEVYETGQRRIDSFIRMVDGVKLEVQRQVTQQKGQK